MTMIEDEQVGDLAKLYQRDLPGGGYVLIELVREDGEPGVPMVDVAVERRAAVERRDGHVAPRIQLPDGKPCKARVRVERRASAERRAGHQPPVIAEVERTDVLSAFEELYRIARDNVAVARGLLTWQAARRAD
ncbi:MAG: hypothetical protein ACYC4J_08360 [Gemmatimonadaceae bacterium]